MTDYRLSPSDLSFLYGSCLHCFVLKAKYGIRQPSIPLPGIFTQIAAAQNDFYADERIEELVPDFPPGTVRYGERMVQSIPIEFEGLESRCFISGRFDTVVELDDGSFAVVDFKTGRAAEDKTEKYARQLHAYALALENPAPDSLELSPVSRLGLIYFTPHSLSQESDGTQLLEGEFQSIEIPKDDEGYRNFLRDVVELLEGDVPPPAPDECDWCEYRLAIGGLDPDEVAAAIERGEGIAPPTPDCPQCGSSMQLRSGRYGEFWGCPNYPECRGTREV